VENAHMRDKCSRNRGRGREGAGENPLQWRNQKREGMFVVLLSVLNECLYVGGLVVWSKPVRLCRYT